MALAGIGSDFHFADTQQSLIPFAPQSAAGRHVGTGVDDEEFAVVPDSLSMKVSANHDLGLGEIVPRKTPGLANHVPPANDHAERASRWRNGIPNAQENVAMLADEWRNQQVGDFPTEINALFYSFWGGSPAVVDFFR